MPAKEVRFHKGAVAEAQVAYDWYAAQNPVAAEAFVGDWIMQSSELGRFRMLDLRTFTARASTCCDGFRSQ